MASRIPGGARRRRTERVKPRILLCDDHALVRAGFRALLNSIGEFDVVGEAGDGREAVQQARALEPDVVLMDIAMPEMNGLDAIARITQASPGTRVIVVSMHATEAYLVEALRAGAAGYVMKSTDGDELTRAIHDVMQGRLYLSPAVSQFLAEGLLRGNLGEGQGEREALSARQREVLQLIAEGHPTRAIAKRLHLAVKTIEAHRAQIMQRLEIHDVAGLTRYAIRIGLVDPER